MVLSGLTILVGLTSISVNRFLVTSHEQVLTESIAIIRRAERVGLDADLAGTLAAQLARAGTEADVTRSANALSVQIDRITSGITDLRHFLTETGGDPTETAEVRAMVAQLAHTVRQKNRLAAAAQAERAGLEDAAERLTQLISAQTDLARLRITAGIWQIYAAPLGQDLRPLLDQLADVDFFAFERIRDLAEATAGLSRAVQQIGDTGTETDLPLLRTQLEDSVALAQARIGYLPSDLAVQSAGQDLAQFRGTLGNRGMIALRGEELSALTALSALEKDLNARLDVLTAEARRGQEAARALMQGRIADAGWQATMLTIALALILVGGVLAGYLVWARTRRGVVSRLGVVAERIVQVARGDTGARMPISGHDEIGRLEKAVNVLRRRTDDALRLRQSLEQAVLARTADVVAETRSANMARAEAEEESRAKTHFLARMSHEIRTPLNGVIGLLDLHAAEESDPARRARLQTALTSARDLQALTEDILTFSSGEETAAQTRLGAFDPARLAQGLAEHLQVLARTKGLLVTVQIAETMPPALLGEAARIRQVMVNLISNAVKYTHKGEVRLLVSHRASAGGRMHDIALSVVDTGPGMTAEETRHAFDIYGRTVDARRRGLAGVGLGLAIVRQLTDAMGGELRVSSTPSRGSSFTLALRLPSADPASLISDEHGEASFAGLGVLVVDDHPVNRLVARGYLERMGCTVAEAATGAEALVLAQDGRFDAMLIDLDLPDMRGEEVAAQITRNGARVVVATADLVRDDADTRARFGVDHVLTKPLSPRALTAVLSGVSSQPKPDDNPPEAALRADIADLGGDLVTSIVTEFLADLAAAVPAILAEDSADQRCRAAHRLKGSASNFALHDLCGLLQRIQSDDAVALDRLLPAADQAAATLRAAARQAGLQLPPDTAKQ